MPELLNDLAVNCEKCVLMDNTIDPAKETGIADFFAKLLSTEGFPPRWECGTGWTTAHGFTHIIADFAIFGAYFAIPVVLAYFVIRRKDVPFPPVMWLFVCFIALCGISHLVEGTIFWTPWYRLSALVKVATALVSWITVFALIRIVPSALNLPDVAKMNERLVIEAEQRAAVESSLRDRAEDLEQMNSELAAASRSTVQREDRMIDLKIEVNQLLQRLGEEPRYKVDYDNRDS